MGNRQPVRELRYVPFEAWELREDDDGPLLEGYASVFNVEATLFDMWREKVAPGAYKKTIQENDIRALWNHNTDLVLGRNKAGTLQLEENAKGLKVKIRPPDTQAGRDAVTSVKRGDVSQMSIAFQIIKQEWETGDREKGKLPLRTVKEAKLFEVSPVTFAAFEQTSIQARDGLLLPDLEPDPLAEARRLVRCAAAGMPLSDEQREYIAAARDLLEPFLLEPEHDHSESADSEPDSHYSGQEDEPGERLPDGSQVHSDDWRGGLGEFERRLMEEIDERLEQLEQGVNQNGRNRHK